MLQVANRTPGSRS